MVLLGALLVTVPAWSLDLPNPRQVIREVRGKIHRVAREVKGAVRSIAEDAARHDGERVRRYEAWNVEDDEPYIPYAPGPYARPYDEREPYYDEEPPARYYEVPSTRSGGAVERRVPFSHTDPSSPIMRPGTTLPHANAPADRMIPATPQQRDALEREQMRRDNLERDNLRRDNEQRENLPREAVVPELRREAAPLPEAAPLERPPITRNTAPPLGADVPRTAPPPSPNSEAARPQEMPPTPKIAPPPGDDRVESARPVPGKPGLVYPPGAEETSDNWVDVREFKAGQLVRNPRTGKLFRVP